MSLERLFVQRTVLVVVGIEIEKFGCWGWGAKLFFLPQ